MSRPLYGEKLASIHEGIGIKKRFILQRHPGSILDRHTDIPALRHNDSQEKD
jgi:hypothetical protein